MLKCAVSESGRFGQRKGGQAGSHESCVINPNRLGQLHALQRRAARQGLHSDLLHAVAGDEAQRLAGEKCQTAERFHSGGQSHFAQGGIGIMERSVIIFLSVERPCRQTADIVRGKVEIVVHPSVHIHFRPVGHAGQVDLFHAGVVERVADRRGAGKGDPSGNPDLGKLARQFEFGDARVECGSDRGLYLIGGHPGHIDRAGSR